MPKPITESDVEQSALELGNLSQIRAVILPKLMSGKIRVPIEVMKNV